MFDHSFIYSNPPVNVVRDINLTGWELQHLFDCPRLVLLRHRYQRDELSGQTSQWRFVDWRHVQFNGTWKTQNKSNSQISDWHIQYAAYIKLYHIMSFEFFA